VITTPGVAYLTKTGPFLAGVMISASHNPYRDNGIKVFGHSGFKLPDEEEDAIEREILRIREQGLEPRPTPLFSDEALAQQYLEYLASTAKVRLDGVRLVLDCGNDGRNFNLNCGALHLEAAQKKVLECRANYGVAFDGDADRAIFVSSSGRVVNGDAVLLLAAREMKDRGRLRENMVVTTVMANLGLEKALERVGVEMVRTPVGDKYVLEEMVRRDAMLGGEQSGHVIFREFATTGDGILTALRVFETVQRSGKGLDELTADLKVFPQKLVNVRVREKKGLLEVPAIAAEIRRVEEEFAGSGRVVVRFSGTEPLARVMVEGPDLEQVERSSESIAAVIQREMGA